MVNKTSRLQGWADPPSVPGWELRALEAVKKRQKKSKRSSERKGGVLVTHDPEMKPYLDEAAKRRGMSMAGYARRAVAAMIAHDLGIPFQEVTRFMSQPTAYRESGGAGRPLVRLDDDGTGHGDWAIIELGPVADYNSEYADHDSTEGVRPEGVGELGSEVEG